MINFLISSSVFILIVILFRFLCRKHIDMRLQYMIWLLVAVKLLIFPVPWIESRLSIFNIPAELEAIVEQRTGDSYTVDNGIVQNSNIDTESAAGNGTAGNNPRMDGSITSDNSRENSYLQNNGAQPGESAFLPIILQAAALTGSCVFLLFWAFTNIKFGVFLKKHRIDLCCKIELPFEMKLPVYAVPGLPAPCLYGRAIYVTTDNTMDKAKLRHILAHEYSHYRQGDLLWSLIRGICLSIYWWHPLVWLAAHLSKQDCELSCDEAALKLLGEQERLDYGKTLLSLITLKSAPRDYFSVATTMTKGKNNLKRRIAMIAKKPRVMIPVCVLVVFATVLGLFCTSTAKRNTDHRISLTSGTYIMEGTGNGLGATILTIDAKEQTFTFPSDPLNSYLPIGNYEIDGDYVKARTDDGMYHYTFKILDNETLVYVDDGLPKPAVIDETFYYTAPYDGAVFTLGTLSEGYTREEILSWFDGTGEPDVDYYAEPVWTEDGVLYYLPVKDERMNDLQAFLLDYFNKDEVNTLLEKKIGDYPPFMEIDGVLYRGMGLVGNDND